MWECTSAILLNFSFYHRVHQHFLQIARVFLICVKIQQQPISNKSLTDAFGSSEMKSSEIHGRQPEFSKKALFLTPPAIEPRSLRVELGAFAQPKQGGKYSRLRRELSLANRSGTNERICVVTVDETGNGSELWKRWWLLILVGGVEGCRLGFRLQWLRLWNTRTQSIGRLQLWMK